MYQCLLAFPWQHIHFVLRRPRDRSLSLVDRALATPDTLLLAQSSREGFEVLYRLSATHSVCVLPDKKQRVPITWEFLPAFLAILPSYVLHCIQTCPTHTSGDGIGSDIIVCDTTRRCCVLPLTNARNTKETERESGGGSCMHGMWIHVRSNIHYRARVWKSSDIWLLALYSKLSNAPHLLSLIQTHPFMALPLLTYSA